MTDKFAFDAPPENLGRLTEYRDLHLPLFVLFSEIVKTGQQTIKGRTFINCTLMGPAVMAPTRGGVAMRDCDLGNAHGDIRNLLLRPEGPLVVGAIPFEDCNFQGCRFRSVGFAGTDEFIRAMLKIPTEG